MFLTVAFAVLTFVLTYVYFRGIYNKRYWNKRGVVFYEKHKSGGPFWEYFIGNKSFFEILTDIYNNHEDAPAVGIGSFFNKALYVKDPVNIQHMTHADFPSFYHRGFPYIEEDLLAHNVLLLHGPEWKLIRQKLSPLFTVAKLKSMYYIIDRSAQDFVEYLKLNPDKLTSDGYDITGHFCAAAISAAVFGIGTKSTFDSPFCDMVRDALTPTMSLNLKFVIGGLSNELFEALKLNLFGKHEDFFVGAMKQVIKQREQEGVKRHDFVDLCVNLKKNGTMVDPDTGFSLEPTDEVLAAQAFFFFLAGVDPSSATMFAAMMELGRHPEIQERVHKEVDAIFEKYNNQLTYDAITEMGYLDNIISECLRLYSPVGLITRQCTKDTVLPVGNIPVEKGTKIIKPVYEIHHDPKYYPNPEVFDPDRFSREGEVKDMTYLPFGRGKRYCIGHRYARAQLLSGLMHLLKHYSLKTHVGEGGIKYNKEQTLIKLKNVNVEIIPRNK
ncbi:putative cytochrome P450 6a13 [Anticarsia gemmatalis]|uniref:putative cytochrome P450 6a13 n=1 Tax=Anticarsia gemmatalis TaxID=129554 RepID=UPI003F76A90F